MVLALDPVSCTATLGPRVAVLTRREFAVLDLLERAAGAVVAHERLLGEVWGPNTARANLRVAIAGLRRKLEPDPELPAVILAVPKLGYRLAIDGAPTPDPNGHVSQHSILSETRLPYLVDTKSKLLNEAKAV